MNLFRDYDNVIPSVYAAVAIEAPNEQLLKAEERENIARNVNYFETIIQLYSNQHFREHLRLSRQNFEVRLNIVRMLYDENYIYANYLLGIVKQNWTN